jgi:hypothetical protein
MRLGTRSVLFGAHAFWLHPWVLAVAWWRLYGFPWHPLLWLSFFVHDLGYVGKVSMDDADGENHPYWGAFVLGAFGGIRWFEFVLYHSRYLAKQHGKQYSRLCVADKLAIAIVPTWIYLPMVKLTGEVWEYMHAGKHVVEAGQHDTPETWFAVTRGYMLDWVAEHKDLKEDTWTPKR